MRLEEALGQLKVHELIFQERNSRDEEQALLYRAFNKSKKDQRGSYSSGRGQGRKGKAKDYGGEVDGEKKTFNKSKVKYSTCQKLGNFADECELPKREKSMGKEKMNMAQEEEDKEDESSLLIMIADEDTIVLLQGMSSGTPITSRCK